MFPSILVNGKIVPANAPYFTTTNRLLRYGDGLFEGLRMMNGEILFFEDHIRRLLDGMKALGLTGPDNFTPAYFYKLVTDLLKANSINGDVLIRIQVYRAGEGLYEPVTDNVEYFIELLQAPADGFKWNDSGIKLGVFEGWKKELNPAMHFKTSNALVYVMAARHKREMKWDDAVILNTKGNVCDAISSSVFMWKNNKLITPVLHDGPVRSVTRKNLLEFAFLNKIKIEERTVTREDLFKADEIFLTNISKGIRWVEYMGESKLGNTNTKELANKFYSNLLQKE